jgi:hypothetical protein
MYGILCLTLACALSRAIRCACFLIAMSCHREKV